MERYYGKICPVCKTEIAEGNEIRICKSCDVPHHENCWIINKGCATFGCFEQNCETRNSKTKAIKGIVTAVSIIMLIVVAVLIFQDEDFEDMYSSEYRSYSWCAIFGDGKIMTIDTNPYNEKKDAYIKKGYDLYFEDSSNAIQRINKDLGFTDKLWDRMLSTRSIDGKQYDYVDGYQVSWTYHPDKGLEVRYEITK